MHLCTLSLGQRTQLLISVDCSSMFSLPFCCSSPSFLGVASLLCTVRCPLEGHSALWAGLMVAFAALIKTLQSKLMATVRLNLLFLDIYDWYALIGFFFSQFAPVSLSGTFSSIPSTWQMKDKRILCQLLPIKAVKLFLEVPHTTTINWKTSGWG